MLKFFKWLLDLHPADDDLLKITKITMVGLLTLFGTVTFVALLVVTDLLILPVAAIILLLYLYKKYKEELKDEST